MAGPPSDARNGSREGSDETIPLKEAAERAGVSTATLKRWADSDVIPEHDGTSDWTPVAVAHA